jgi:hypothetical protein
MSSLAELPELVGFFSYSRDDDEDFKGSLSALRDGIQRELRAQLGRNKTNFHLFQDQEAIAPGKQWELELKNAIGQSTFFVPLITPRSVGSKYCQFEFESFLAREQAIGRTDLIFPILYIQVTALQNETKWRSDPVLSVVGQRQYVDWRPVRHLDVNTPVVREKIENFCRTIVEALNETWVSPEERQRIAEAKARQLAEEERLEAEAKQKAEAEQRQRQAEAEAKRRADQEQAEAKRRAAELEGRRKAEAETLRRAEEARGLREAEAKRKAEEDEERAFAAAKRIGDVRTISAFLASFPGGRFANEAQSLRDALLVRQEEQRRRQTEAEAKRRAEQEQAETRRRAAEEESRRKAKAETLRPAEEARGLLEAEAKRRAQEDEERAFAAAKRIGDVRTISAFLASFPGGRFASEAQSLRDALLNPTSLKAPLTTHPENNFAKHIGSRLRVLEPRAPWVLLSIVVAIPLISWMMSASWMTPVAPVAPVVPVAPPVAAVAPPAAPVVALDHDLEDQAGKLGFNINRGTVILGVRTLTSSDYSSKSKCLQQCAQSSKCYAFDFDVTSQTCHLYPRGGTLTPFKTYDSGQRY